MPDFEDHDACRTAIWQLQQTLAGHGLPAETAESAPLLVVAGNPDDATFTVTVRCEPRPSDGGRLWFWLDDGAASTPRPLTEADRLADAVVHICGERKNRTGP
ncbi:MAG: hypothetical protein ABIQ26_13775 [Streptosporangiaceae bacterium]